MNAEEWLLDVNEKEGSEYTVYDCSPVLMERYANYKTKELYILLFRFRNEIALNGGLYNFKLLKKFDKHFKIEIKL